MAKNKKFLVSVDTEGDNLWNWRKGDLIYTENANYLDRFHTLCEKYGFIPTYLTNYEMAMDPVFVKFAEYRLARKTCEIGMHLHAWNNPPIVKLDNAEENGGQPYLIEYPPDIMEEKICTVSNLLRERFGNIISHRAGRWTTDKTYFSILNHYGYRVDCSVTPGINWSNNKGETRGSCGSDYSLFRNTPFLIENTDMIEVPLTIIKSKHFIVPDKISVKNLGRNFIHTLRGQSLWIRPLPNRFHEMLEGLKEIQNCSNSDYAMFMIHSSELMPGGSPSFKNEQDIDNMYEWMEKLFKIASKTFTGQSIGDYGMTKLTAMRSEIK